ncbi:MAG: hypothetical protein HY565_01355 [Candidatus Kerfeldbacteria bacterium]|nr:hypothetical protein [Candidatus Kerfeldbacteria bacterium]
MALRLEQSLRQDHRLTHEQRLELKQLLLLRQELQSPAPMEAVKGLEGIGVANKLLQQKGLRGILIGSVAVDIWKTADPSSLSGHKDVDVAVLPIDHGDMDFEQFEGGIDWWLPRQEHLEVKEQSSRREGTFQWWENGNEVVIGFGLRLSNVKGVPNIPAGLSIPTPRWLANMQYAETLARQDSSKVHVSEGALDGLQRDLEKKVNPKKLQLDGVVPLNAFVPYRFQFGVEKIPEDKAIPLELDGLDLPMIVAINSRKQK